MSHAPLDSTVAGKDLSIGMKHSWKLIPALGFAGVLSGGWTFSFFSAPLLLWKENYPLYVLLASLCFGLSLVTVVWYYGLIRNWIVLTALVGMTVCVHFLEYYVHRFQSPGSLDYTDVPVLGSITPSVVVTSFAVAFVLSFGFLIFAKPRRSVVVSLLIAIACAGLAAMIVGTVDGSQKDAWISFLRGRALELVWQIALAFCLGTALLLKHLNLPGLPRAASGEAVVWGAKRFLAFVPLVIFLAITAGWSHNERQSYGKRMQELEARRQAALAQSLAETPSFDNLPTIVEKPAEELLVLKEIGGMSPYAANQKLFPEDRKVPVSESRRYRLSYVGGEGNIGVTVTEFPTAEWAKYSVRNIPRPNIFIDSPESVRRAVRFGNNVYDFGLGICWPSGNRIINLDTSGLSTHTPQPLDEVLKAYLQKYPSSL